MAGWTSLSQAHDPKVQDRLIAKVATDKAITAVLTICKLNSEFLPTRPTTERL